MTKCKISGRSQLAYRTQSREAYYEFEVKSFPVGHLHIKSKKRHSDNSEMHFSRKRHKTTTQRQTVTSQRCKTARDK